MFQKKGEKERVLKTAGLAIAMFAILFVASCGQSSAPGSTNFTETNTGMVKRPWGMTFSQDYSLLYVANSSQNSISIYDAASMTEVGNIATTCKPFRMAFNSDYTKMFVTHDISGVNGGANQCYKSQLSHGAMADGSYVSVIDMSTMLVTKEISMSVIRGIRDIVYDANNDVIYVTGSDFSFDEETEKYASPGSCIIDGSSDEKVECFENDPLDTKTNIKTEYYGFNAIFPSKIVMDHDRNLMYAISPANDTIGFIKPVLPRSGVFDLNTYNAQETGYCFGTERKNGCGCTSGNDCASRSCDTSATLPFCSPSCESSSGYPDGCSCSSDSECRSDLCDSSVCKSFSSLNVNTIAGYCNRDTNDCYDSGEEQFLKNEMSDLGLCTEPWDIEVLSDNTAYVSCFGKFDNDDVTDADDIKDPLLRVMWDTNGLSRFGNVVITFDSARLCDRPTEITSDPSGRYVFVVCYGNDTLLAINQSTGDVLQAIEVPDTPVDVVASDDYFFVSSMLSTSIYRYPIADLPLQSVSRPQVIKMKQ